MAWCHQAPSHYLHQCWPKSMLPYGITRPQWVKQPLHLQKWYAVKFYSASAPSTPLPWYKYFIFNLCLPTEETWQISMAISGIWIIPTFYVSSGIVSGITRAANQYGTSVFCTDLTCKIREYEFGLQNTEIELCQFCHLRYYCQNKAYLFWVANQSRFVVFYALKPSNTSLITKTFILLSTTCGR